MAPEDMEQRVTTFRDSIERSVKGGYDEQTMQQAVWDFVKSFKVQLPYNTANEFWNGEANNYSSSNNSWNQWANGEYFGGFNFKKRNSKKHHVAETAADANTVDEASHVEKKNRSERKSRSRKQEDLNEE